MSARERPPSANGGAGDAGVSAREAVLARIRAALGDRTVGAAGGPDDAYRSADPAAAGDRDDALRGSTDAVSRAEVLDRFVERVADYKATVVRCDATEAADAVAEALHGARRVVVPDGFPADLLPGTIDRVRDDGLSHQELDAIDGVLTTARVGIAETGTIVLDHGVGQGRRALTLLPDLHVCIVRADQVVADVPSAVGRLDPARPQTWISGPSATSDIELDRVEGVHGPRNLHVVVIG